MHRRLTAAFATDQRPNETLADGSPERAKVGGAHKLGICACLDVAHDTNIPGRLAIGRFYKLKNGGVVGEVHLAVPSVGNINTIGILNRDSRDAVAVLIHHALAHGKRVAVRLGREPRVEHIAVEQALGGLFVHVRPGTRRGDPALGLAGHRVDAILLDHRVCLDVGVALRAEGELGEIDVHRSVRCRRNERRGGRDCNRRTHAKPATWGARCLLSLRACSCYLGKRLFLLGLLPIFLLSHAHDPLNRLVRGIHARKRSLEPRAIEVLGRRFRRGVLCMGHRVPPSSNTSLSFARPRASRVRTVASGAPNRSATS